MNATDRDLALDLVRFGEEDLQAVQAMLDVAPIADTVVALHAQQAVEHALKAVLALEAIEYPLTHDIDALAELCEATGTEVPAELDEADLLTPYAAAARYDQPRAGNVDRHAACRFAQAAIAWARQVVDGSRVEQQTREG